MSSSSGSCLNSRDTLHPWSPFSGPLPFPPSPRAGPMDRPARVPGLSWCDPFVCHGQTPPIAPASGIGRPDHLRDHRSHGGNGQQRMAADSSCLSGTIPSSGCPRGRPMRYFSMTIKLFMTDHRNRSIESSIAPACGASFVHHCSSLDIRDSM